MFNSKTLFIVGAGASNEIGLPIGNELMSKVAEKVDIKYELVNKQISGDRAIAQALRDFVAKSEPHDINPYLQEAWKIRDGMKLAPSIDNYIDAHSDNQKLVLCGKLGIVQAILEAESLSKLYIDQTQRYPKMNFGSLTNTWFVKFIQILVENIKKQDVKNIFQNVSFIVFNYDRCIEHFLAEALQSYYTISPAEAQEIVRQVTILHPYGVVGRLPWQTNGGGVPYGQVGGYSLLPIVEQIKTFTERVEDLDALAAMHHQIQEAETVVFLGFGFLSLNMDMLSLKESSKTTRVFATAYDISPSDIDVITPRILTMLGRKPKNTTIHISNKLKCSDLFDEYRRSLSGN